MQAENQPKTTNHNPVRDAAVQIGAEGETKVSQAKTEEEKFDEECRADYEKANAIWTGALAENITEYCAGFYLALQLKNLTSAKKSDRDYAKEQIRKLARIGRDVQSQKKEK